MPSRRLQEILFRGDTDFSQTSHLDRWDAAGARFIFGIPAMRNLVELAEGLDSAAPAGPSAWKPLRRKAKYTVRTERRACGIRYDVDLRRMTSGCGCPDSRRPLYVAGRKGREKPTI
jgi:hypothetical protein